MPNLNEELPRFGPAPDEDILTSELLTSQEAADLVGISNKNLRGWVLRGVLVPARVVQRAYLFTRSSVEDFRRWREQRRPGRRAI